MKKKIAISVLTVAPLAALGWIWLFGIGWQQSWIISPTRVQFFAHDRLLLIRNGPSEPVFIVHPLPDKYVAEFQRWLSPENFSLKQVWINADRIYDAWHDQTERHDALDFGIRGQATAKTASDLYGSNGAALSLGGDDFPYRSVQLISVAEAKKLAAAPPDFDAPVYGRLRFSTYWRWQFGTKPEHRVP